MDRGLDSFIATICEEELQDNQEYVNVQKKMAESYKKKDIALYSELSLQLQVLVEVICYRKASKDKYSLMTD